MEGYISRGIETRLAEALTDTPVVVLQGPRQCGKTTLVRRTCDLPYITLDDSLTLAAVVRNPDAWLAAQPKRLIIDEIQRAPQLLRSIKRAVDEDRSPGRFVLTGSANVLLSPKVGDSLAGRMEILTLWPLAQSEIQGQLSPFVDRLLAGTLGSVGSPDQSERGGFPEPAARASESRRRAWFQSYVRALMDRDVRDLAQIEGLANLPNLLALLARNPYAVQNVSQLSRDTGIPATSLTRYLSLLEAVYLIRAIPAHRTSEPGRAAKTARLAFVDHGLWRYLSSDVASPEARLSFIAMELLKESGWSQHEYEVRHFRSTLRHSVPIVIRLADGTLIGIAHSPAPVPSDSDFDGLRFFAEVTGEEFRAGIVLTEGTTSGAIGEGLSYAPFSTLWSSQVTD